MIFKELKELRSDLKLQQIENGRKQEQIIDLKHENRDLQAKIEELRMEKDHLEKQLDQALKDYDKVMEAVNGRAKRNTRK